MLGEAPPRVRVEPALTRDNSWEDVADLSARAGVVLDGWQELVLQCAMGERSDATWAAKRVGLSVPRQNGKSQLLVARALAGALLFGELKIVISAHQQDTARESFTKLLEIIDADANGWLRSRIRPNGIMQALNREAVKFTNGATIQFKARSGSASRGFSSDCLMLDEAQILSQRAWVSINSTMSAMPNPQVWLLGTPPTPEDDGEVFGNVRSSAMSGTSNAVAWLEWAADPSADPSQELTRWSANPAWNKRINHEVVDGEFETYPAERFALDRLGIWDDPTQAGVIPASLWNDDLDPSSAIAGAPRFALDVSPSRAWAAVAVAGKRRDGIPHVEVTSRDGQIDHREGVDWVVPRVVELNAAFPGMVLALASGSAAESLVPALLEAGISLEFVKGNDVSAACGLFYDLATTNGLRHTGQLALTGALLTVRKNVDNGEGAWRWGRKRSAADITPLYAATYALWSVMGTDDRNPVNNVW